MLQAFPRRFSWSSFHLISLLTGLWLLLALAGCGGGGGSSSASLSISAPSVTEGDTGNVAMTFTVTLSEAAERTVTLDWTTTDATATAADGDYTAASGQLTIPQGGSTADITIDVNGDDDFEADETVEVTLSNARGIALAQASYTGQGTISNDDDADPKGYFTGTGTLDSQNLSDLTGMAYNNRLMVFSPSANLLIDITLDSVTLQNFSAIAQVYANGDITDPGSQANISLSGTTDEASISASFTAGSALAGSSFTLNFDQNNNIGATLDRIVVTGTILDRWGGDIYGVEVSTDVGVFTPQSNGDYVGTDEGKPSCGYVGTLVIPSSDNNIYQLAHDVLTLNGCLYVSAGHSGFASVVAIGGIDTLVYAFANGDFGFFAIMEKI